MKKYNKIILCLLPLMLLTCCGTNNVKKDIEILKYNSEDISDSVRNLKFDESSRFYDGAELIPDLDGYNNRYFFNYDKNTQKYGVISSLTDNVVIKPTLVKDDFSRFKIIEDFLIEEINSDQYKVYDNLGTIIYEGQKIYIKKFKSIDKENCFEFSIKSLDDYVVVITGIIKDNLIIKDKTVIKRKRYDGGFYDLYYCGLDGYVREIGPNNDYIILKDDKVVNQYNVGEKYLHQIYLYEFIQIGGYEIVSISSEGEEPYLIKLDLLSGKQTRIDTSNFSIGSMPTHFKNEKGINEYALIGYEDEDGYKSVIVDKDLNIYNKTSLPPRSSSQANFYKIDEEYIIGSFNATYDSKLNVIHVCEDESSKIFNPKIKLEYKVEQYNNKNRYCLFDYEGNPYKGIKFYDGGSFVGTNGLWYMKRNELFILHNIDPVTHLPSEEETFSNFKLIAKTDSFALFLNDGGRNVILTPDYELTLIDENLLLYDELCYTINPKVNLLKNNEGIYNIKLK